MKTISITPSLVILWIIGFFIFMGVLLIIQGVVRYCKKSLLWRTSLHGAAACIAITIPLMFLWYGSNHGLFDTKNEPPVKEPVSVISFDEVYHAYEENELKAADIYKGNRYILQGKVNGIKAGRFLASGGATLTMENNVDGVTVFYYAEFGKDQEDGLKTINTGDTITFEGTCSNAGAWSDCELK